MPGEYCSSFLNVKGFPEKTEQRGENARLAGVHVVPQQSPSVSDAGNSAGDAVRLAKCHPASSERCRVFFCLQRRCKIAKSTLLILGFGSQLLFGDKTCGARSFAKIVSV